MDLRTVTDDFAVAPQFAPEDMAEVAAQGYSNVICNRPDGEEPGQPSTASMRSAAEAAGMSFHQIPVSGGAFPPDAIEGFRTVRQESEGKTLAYCRSGTRSITLETLANPDGLGVEQRLERAAAAGYDLSGMRPHLQD